MSDNNSELWDMFTEFLQNLFTPETVFEEIPIFESKYSVFTKKRVLVLSGGGIKGIAHLGALQALSEINCFKNIDTFAGTSIGGLVSLMMVIGYKPNEFYEIVKRLDISKFHQFNLEMLFTTFGFDNGTNLEFSIKKLVTAKGFNENTTMKELYDLTKKTLIIPSVCVNTGEALYMSYISTPDMPIVKAVMMTTCIPFIYSPVKHNDMLYIDGACIDNFPMHMFKDRLDEVVGVYLVDQKDTCKTVDNLETFMSLVLKSLINGSNFNTLKGYEKYTLTINANISATKFDLDESVKVQLYNNGYEIMKKYIADKITTTVLSAPTAPVSPPS